MHGWLPTEVLSVVKLMRWLDRWRHLRACNLERDAEDATLHATSGGICLHAMNRPKLRARRLAAQEEDGILVALTSMVMVTVMEGRLEIFGSSRAPPARVLPLNWARCVILANRQIHTGQFGHHWPCTRIQRLSAPCP